MPANTWGPSCEGFVGSNSDKKASPAHHRSLPRNSLVSGAVRMRQRWIASRIVALCSMGALLLGEGASWAEPLAPVTVIAQGCTPFLKDLTLEEVRGRACDDARRSAIEQAVGVFVRGSVVVHNSQIVEELGTTLVRGVIEQEQWLEERIEEVSGEQDGRVSE